MEKEDKILVVENLRTQFFTYGGVVEALDDVSFDIFNGEIFGLVGESGCGKSVTVASVMGLVQKPGKVISGKVLLEGEDLLQKSDREMNWIRGSRISVISQDPTSSLNPLFRIGYQVSEPMIFHRRVKKKAAWAEAEQLLLRMGVPDATGKARNFPHELSGGMRQRAVIAMALACNPDLLIADEPTTNLDVTIERQILNLVRQLQKYLGTSVLWITHDMAVIAEMCDRVAVMYAGNIVELSDVRTIFKNPAHPYTVKLLKAIPSAESTAKELDEIPGAVPQLINPPSGCRFHPRCERALAICSEEKPEAVKIDNGHKVACHLYS
jgi:oligopeptide/dipeptide ABC transporter ATP-binding protein